MIEGSGFKHGRWLDTVLMQRPLGPGKTTLPDRALGADERQLRPVEDAQHAGELVAALQDRAGRGDDPVGALLAGERRELSRRGTSASRWRAGRSRRRRGPRDGRWRSRAIRLRRPCGRRPAGWRRARAGRRRPARDGGRTDAEATPPPAERPVFTLAQWRLLCDSRRIAPKPRACGKNSSHEERCNRAVRNSTKMPHSSLSHAILAARCLLIVASCPALGGGGYPAPSPQRLPGRAVSMVQSPRGTSLGPALGAGLFLCRLALQSWSSPPYYCGVVEA